MKVKNYLVMPNGEELPCNHRLEVNESLWVEGNEYTVVNVRQERYVPTIYESVAGRYMQLAPKEKESSSINVYTIDDFHIHSALSSFLMSDGPWIKLANDAQSSDEVDEVRNSIHPIHVETIARLLGVDMDFLASVFRAGAIWAAERGIKKVAKA